GGADGGRHRPRRALIPAGLAEFVRRELGPTPDRLRAFGRTMLGLLIATVVIFTVKPTNGYWMVTFVLLVSSPAVGKSEIDALRRILAALIGGAAAVLVIIASYDLPWIYVPLQAVGLGVAIFLAGSTPLGPAAITGGTTFAVITGASREFGAAGFIDLAWDRFAQAMAGSAIAAFAQLTFWREDPL